jgi:hypothetical protein
LEQIVSGSASVWFKEKNMKPIKFAVASLVLTLTLSDAALPHNFGGRIFEQRARSVGEVSIANQTTQKTLTNDDVVKMLAAGLTETTIIQVIQKGPSNFDTSPDALIKLKQQGATAKIIEAMVGPTTRSTTPEPSLTRKGVFAQSGPEWRRIEEVSSVEVRYVGYIANSVTLGIKEQRVICVFRGEKAEMQLLNRRPVFRVAGLGVSARDVYIVEMRLNPDRRDLEMGRSGLIKKLSYGFRKRDVHDVEVKRLGDDLLEVTPKQDLEPGEYILVLGGVSVPLNSSAGKEGTTGYDFGIKVVDKVASK